ncbi:MAG: hypothetical protein ABS76_11365 [Pelagibacterium sp. SCN 64-44]|nr:MAG: hypothetical protein ABS76_11365 [Pelagibacterium sp. SCN 64-44]
MVRCGPATFVLQILDTFCHFLIKFETHADPAAILGYEHCAASLQNFTQRRNLRFRGHLHFVLEIHDNRKFHSR